MFESNSDLMTSSNLDLLTLTLQPVISVIDTSTSAAMATTAKKLDVFTTTSDYSKTYVFHEEDHTLGNALRYVLMRKYVRNWALTYILLHPSHLCSLSNGSIIACNCSPDVDFCGYTIPHPSEPKMHIRLQTRQGKMQLASRTDGVPVVGDKLKGSGAK